ncbi:glycosyltransferase family 4 protein [Sphingomonas faeni]|uniref:glycosyltransferase family 4 protein n=1 Tax=Sphingomonas faeni TaxID=185950 RepID=UPI00334C617A
MLDYFVAHGAPARLRDTGGGGTTKLKRTMSAALALAVGGKRHDRAYLSVPGQRGVWLFVLLVLILRLRGIEHWVHHHSFRPINLGPSRAMRALVAAGGRRQHHILLSNDMRRRFAGLYLDDETDDRATSLSNAYLFGPRIEDDHPRARPQRPVTLGHMSVLTREKGVPYLLDLFAGLAARGHDWRLVIAGPCADPALRAALAAATVAAPDGRPGLVEYRGSVAGAEKERFFADVDLFVLPTTLIDEAEPLVMLEAFARGVEVVANDTGCIRDRIRTPGHLMTLDHDRDLALIEERVADLAGDWTTAQQSCIAHARAINAGAEVEAARFFPRLLAPFGGVASSGSPVT